MRLPIRYNYKTYIEILCMSSTVRSHKMETYQMETIPYMETFLIYQMVY